MSVVLPSLPIPVLPSGRSESRVTVQPGAPKRDLLRESGVSRSKVETSAAVRGAAERLVEEHRSASAYIVADGRTRRAIATYDAVARHNALEYVSTVLGIDEFA